MYSRVSSIMNLARDSWIQHSIAGGGVKVVGCWSIDWLGRNVPRIDGFLDERSCPRATGYSHFFC
jgi:hypothetical protein